MVPFLKHFPELVVFNAERNPFVSRIKSYKKTLVAACPTLTQLDGKIVSDMERMKAKKETGFDFDAQIMKQELVAKDPAIWQHSAAEQGRLLFN